MWSLTRTETIIRHERWIVVAGLTAIVVLSWIYVLAGAGTGMSTLAMTTWQFPPPMALPQLTVTWDVTYWAIMIAMWWVMMIAMMVPSAAPMILLYARVCRHGQQKGKMEVAVIPTAAFALGYVLAWLGFSVVATALQWGLERLGVVHSMMMWSTSAYLTAGFLIAAGLYQISPLKEVCLHHCRSPAEFLSRHWRKGPLGAMRIGIIHGGYCVGCCWFLMALLFAGGIMNLLWIAGLAALVLVEKVAPNGRLVAHGSGAVLVAAGTFIAYTAMA